jgi:hypothetical protein
LWEGGDVAYMSLGGIDAPAHDTDYHRETRVTLIGEFDEIVRRLSELRIATSKVKTVVSVFVCCTWTNAITKLLQLVNKH